MYVYVQYSSTLKLTLVTCKHRFLYQNSQVICVYESVCMPTCKREHLLSSHHETRDTHISLNSRLDTRLDLRLYKIPLSTCRY